MRCRVCSGALVAVVFMAQETSIQTGRYVVNGKIRLFLDRQAGLQAE
jgi:hypothetical protein